MNAFVSRSERSRSKCSKVSPKRCGHLPSSLAKSPNTSCNVQACYGMEVLRLALGRGFQALDRQAHSLSKIQSGPLTRKLVIFSRPFFRNEIGTYSSPLAFFLRRSGLSMCAHLRVHVVCASVFLYFTTVFKLCASP